jgi:soluble lytic murein transglycosylase-like protein
MTRVGAALTIAASLLAAGVGPGIAAPRVEASVSDLLDLAQRYEHGEGVARDPARAIDAYCRAVGQGSGDAAYRLGWIYYFSRGVGRDDQTAAGWFATAAAMGHVQAANVIERFHLSAAGGPVACADPPPSPPPPARSVRAPAEIDRMVTAMAAGYALDPRLVLAVIQVESNFVPNAVSPKGALGLMQLLPETAQRFGVVDVMNPKENIAGGMKYLRWLLCNLDGNVTFALASYNAGLGAVLKYGGVPPYPETQSYVKFIRKYYTDERHDGLSCAGQRQG